MLALAPLTFAVFGSAVDRRTRGESGRDPVHLIRCSCRWCWRGPCSRSHCPRFERSVLRRCGILDLRVRAGRPWSGRPMATGPLWRASAPPWWFALRVARRGRRVAVALAGRRCGWSGACAVLPLLFAPTRMPEPGTRARQHPRRRPRLGGAHRDPIACAAVRHGRQLEHRAVHACVRSSCPRSMRSARSIVTSWCFRRSTPDRPRAQRCWRTSAESGIVRVGGGWPGTSLPGGACDGFAFRLGRRASSSTSRGPGRPILRAARRRPARAASC